ncbi:MAG: cell division protein SepF [Candidatus Margulisbacteria bacterium]|jgi:FtsZ-interacting cell division protein YlmF|nr:cell division protein SepF [Candidatus Margulisiibacteriota bacterium]
MSFLEGVKNFLGFSVDDAPPGARSAVLPVPAGSVPPPVVEEKRAVKIPVPLDKEKTNILLIEPRNLEADSQDILRLLKEGHVVLINNKYLDAPSTRTLMDRVLGVVYAFDGCLQKIGGGIFLCAPRSVNVIDNQQNDVIFNEDFVQPESPQPAAPVQTPYAATGTYNATAAQPAYPAARPANAQSSYY